MPEEIKIPTSARKPGGTTGSKRPVSKDAQLHSALSDFYGNVGVLMYGVGSSIGDGGVAGTGMAMTERAGDAADAWMDLARKNTKVRATLERITEAGSFGGLIAVHLIIAMPLLASREMVPPFIAHAFAPSGETPQA